MSVCADREGPNDSFMSAQHAGIGGRIGHRQVPDSCRTIGATGYKPMTVGADGQVINCSIMALKQLRLHTRIGVPKIPKPHHTFETPKGSQPVPIGTKCHACDSSLMPFKHVW